MEDPLKGKHNLLLPHFQRNTAAMLMKDIELERIVQNDKKFAAKVDVMTHHFDQVKKDKAGLSNNISLN